MSRIRILNEGLFGNMLGVGGVVVGVSVGEVFRGSHHVTLHSQTHTHTDIPYDSATSCYIEHNKNIHLIIPAS